MTSIVSPVWGSVTMTCRDCGLSKPLTDFMPNRGCRFGYERLCRECFNRRNRERNGNYTDACRPLDNGERPVCRICGVAKPVADYKRDSRAASGRTGACKSCLNLRRRDAARVIPTPAERESKRLSKLKARYGLTDAQVHALYRAQDGLCAICSRPLARPPAKNTQVDHDHASGAVRGLLCFNCNMGLGYFKDNASSLAAAAAYLRRTVEHGES